MTSTEQRIQVLYELSLSIGAQGDLTETARTALSAYLRKLHCSSGAVLECRRRRDGGVAYETVAMIPSQAAISAGLEAAIARLSAVEGDGDRFHDSLPATGESDDGTRYYIMDLPEFGVLALTRTDPLDSETLAALGPLNEKLATACRGERYEERLREERDRFETIFTTIDEPLASVRPHGGDLLVQRINPAFEATFGTDESAALDRPLQPLLGTPTLDDIPPLVAESGPSTTRLRLEAGEFLVRSSPIRSERADAYLLLFVDITESAARQRQLERFNEVTKALARILRHNIRNDLTVIRARAEQIRDNTDGTQADNARTILRKSEQLSSTAEKAREMRELVAAHDRESSVSLRSAITDAVSSVRHDYPDADIDVSLALPEDVTADSAVGIAVRHLVENGVEHHGPQSRGDADPRPDTACEVTVSATAKSETVRITVSDNGPGIPEPEIAVLERGRETQLEHGSGAGLWIVGQIVDYCDATIDFSTDDGGTTATLTVQR